MVFLLLHLWCSAYEVTVLYISLDPNQAVVIAKSSGCGGTLAPGRPTQKLIRAHLKLVVIPELLSPTQVPIAPGRDLHRQLNHPTHLLLHQSE